MHLVGLLALLHRSLARILDRQPGRDDEHLAHAPVTFRLEHHPPEPRVDREAGEPAAEFGEVPLTVALDRVDRRQLLEQEVPVADRGRVGRLEERERGDVAEADVGHLQDDRREVRAEDLRLGELGPLGEVVLVVQADADARRDTAAPAGALVGRRLRHRLDREPLHLEPLAVAGDPGHAGVDHVAHAGHGERRLGDVGGEHDATLRPGSWDARRSGAARPTTAGRTAAALRASGRRGGRRRRRGSRARPTGTPARRPAPRSSAPRPRRRSPAPGRCRPSAGTAPRPGTSAL